MPFYLLKKYNELLDLLGLTEAQRRTSLRGIFDRDVQNNPIFMFNGKPIYPTPKENGQIALENLFTHLITKVVDHDTNHREFDMSRSQRLHWIKYLVGENKKENMLYFSVDEGSSYRTYIYDMNEKYVIVLESLRNSTAYYLLTAYHLEGRDAARNKILNRYNRRRLPNLL